MVFFAEYFFIPHRRKHFSLAHYPHSYLIIAIFIDIIYRSPANAFHLVFIFSCNSFKPSVNFAHSWIIMISEYFVEENFQKNWTFLAQYYSPSEWKYDLVFYRRVTNIVFITKLSATWRIIIAVSYTHLTLPTIYSV